MPNNIALLPLSRARIPALIGLVDGFPDQTHNLETGLGGAPLENGAFITDHAVARPEKLVMQGYTSNLSDALGAKPTLAWQAIRRLQQDSTPISVITPWHVYTEMLIEKATATPAGLGQTFTLEMTEIIRVNASNENPAGGSLFNRLTGAGGGLVGAATSIISETGSGLLNQVGSLTGLADNLSGGAVGRTAEKVRGRISLIGKARDFLGF